MKPAVDQPHMIRPLVVVPKDMFDAKTIRELRRNGYLVVEASDLSAVRVVTPPPLVPLNGLALIALEVMADEKVESYHIRDVFRKRVLKVAMSAAKGGEIPPPP